MGLNNFLASKVPLYMTAGTKTITLKLQSNSNEWGTVNPALLASGTAGIVAGISPQSYSGTEGGIQSLAAFGAWWQQNPFIVKKLNIRATTALDLPTQIIFQTVDIFSGNIQNQIVDVSAAFQSTQFQNSIVTIPNLEIFVGRSTNIFVSGTPTGTSQAPSIMYIDMTMGNFISLEFALQQAYLTQAGSSESATEIVGAFDNEGTKIAVADINSNVELTPTARAELITAAAKSWKGAKQGI